MTKTFLKAALVAAVAGGLTAPAYAEPFTATANIVKPLTIAKDTDLDFGTITMGSALTSANVDVANSAAAVAVCGTELVCSGTSNPASFTLAGVGTQSVSLTYTAPTTLANSGDSTKTVPFSHNGAGSIGLTDGAATLYVGGQITVASSTVPGVYSGDLTVTASYP